ncbi:DUF58 domain-containing protein [bacterium]|nr:DUF58 domain-containing protein [bacterium]
MKRRRTYFAVAVIGFLACAWVFRIGFFGYVFYAGCLVALFSYLMTYLSLDGLTTERHCSLRQAQIGDECVVTVGVRNTRPTFLPWVVMEDLLGDGLRVTEGAASRATVMRPHGAITLRYRVRCERRGYYRVGPVLFESGDLFGLTRRYLAEAKAEFITVYPRIAPIDKYSVPTHRPMGETTVQMRLFEDPTRIAGVREYQHGDPLRRVHWKASAKTGVLHSKVYDPSCLLGANLVLDFNTLAWSGERSLERSEFGATVAASLATYLATRGVEVGLVSNGVDAADVMEVQPFSVEAVNRDEAREMLERRHDSERLRPVEVEVRRGGESILSIMESLARLSLSDGLPLAEMVSREYNGWPREDTVILIVPSVPQELGREIVRLKTTGFSVLVLLIDNEVHAPRTQAMLANLGVPMLHLRQDSDLHNIVL